MCGLLGVCVDLCVRLVVSRYWCSSEEVGIVILVVGCVVWDVASEVQLRRELRCCLSVRRPACLLEFEAARGKLGSGSGRPCFNKPPFVKVACLK